MKIKKRILMGIIAMNMGIIGCASTKPSGKVIQKSESVKSPFISVINFRE